MARKQPTPQELLLELSERYRQSAVAPNIKKYRPHAKQKVFHTSSKKRRLYLGGNRSGKSVGGVCEDIWRATLKHPYRQDINLAGPSRGRVVTTDFINGIDKTIMPLFKQWLYPSALRGGAWETAYDKGSRTLWFSSGSFIEFMSYDQELDKFSGTSRHWVHFDEEPPKTIFNECLARLIDTNGDYWITMTPVEGMTWVYEDLYEPNYQLDLIDSPVHIIEINTMENPYLSEEAIGTFLDGVDEDEASIRVGGQFVRQGGRVYKNFDPTIGGLHVLREEPDLSLMMDWFWICSLDHGLNNPTAVYWTAWDPNGFGITFKEHYKNELTVEQHAKIILNIEKELGRPPDLRIADPSIKNRNAINGVSILSEYQRHGLSWGEGNNDVKAGIARVKKYFNPHPYVGKRSKGLNVPETLEAFPKLRFSPACPFAIREHKSYRWKTYVNKKQQFENNPYDEPHKKDDHSCDSLRYMIMCRPDLTAAPEKMDEVAKALSQLDNKLGYHNQRAVADPNGLLDPDNAWNELHSVPSGSGEWTFDEHMGGVW